MLDSLIDLRELLSFHAHFILCLLIIDLIYYADMPKQKRYKNLLKAAAAANSSQHKSIAAANSSRDKSATSNASQVKSAAVANSFRDTSAATNFSRHKLATAANISRDKLAVATNSSQDKSASSNSSGYKSAASNSSQDKLASSNSSRDKSSASKSSRDNKHLHLLVKDVHNLPEGLRIVVNFDQQHAVIGEAAKLLVEARFFFKVNDSLAKQFLLQSLGKKWKEHRIELQNEFYDPRLCKTEIINNTSEDIAPNQWTLFVEYRLKPETQEKIEAYSSQQEVELTVNSPLDALGVVLGKEHPGLVRGLGMGVILTVAFKNNTIRISQMNLSSSNDAGTSSTCVPNVQEQLDTVKAQLQALVSYIASKE
ncbi:hypothetical protein Ahy_A06g028391 [Arachis hypogaea]|uniref:Uncharacterized protein n=1 Tax=Arachis hypogaea TaxID=3818 RepID=A0A445CQW8_ARAHY|nr:hypothetical protein Ahy_A06g028391 [Arachis hypogaea]